MDVLYNSKNKTTTTLFASFDVMRIMGVRVFCGLGGMSSRVDPGQCVASSKRFLSPSLTSKTQPMPRVGTANYHETFIFNSSRDPKVFKHAMYVCNMW